MTAKSKFILATALVAASFLLGYVPRLMETWRLESELAETRAQLQAARQQSDIDELRNLAGMMLIEALQQNYGLARDLSTQYFDKLTAVTAEVQNPALNQALSELLAQRDAITAGLTEGSPAVASDLQALLRRTYDLPPQDAAAGRN